MRGSSIHVFRRKWIFRLAIVVVVLLGTGMNSEVGWSGFSSTSSAQSNGFTAAVIPQGSTPTASVTPANGATTTITFGSVGIGGTELQTYTLNRYASGTNAETLNVGSCGAPVNGTVTCTDMPADGRWQYTDTPSYNNWAGTESAKSSAVTIEEPAPTATVTHPVDGTVDTPAYSAGAISGRPSDAASGGALANIPSSSINVLSADGSGTLMASRPDVSASSTGTTIAFDYTAATGGMLNGEVDIAVPSSWPAPTTADAVGCTTASAGSLRLAGHVIKVSALTLDVNAMLIITYGATFGGVCTAGDGVTASSKTGRQTWQGTEKSRSGGTLTDVTPSPSITVSAEDGSGTISPSPASVLAGSVGNTITFTYTTAVGGLSNGTVRLAVPSGWTVPSTIPTSGGYTTSTNGTVTTSGQTITVSGITLAGSGTFDIVYGSTAAGGPGTTATTSDGLEHWPTQTESTSGGALTHLAAQPSITVGASADGSGTISASPATVLAGSAGNTITFTYRAATGGMNSASMAIDVPSGWSAPSTTGTAAGFTTSSTGTVSVAGQTITVSGITLTAGSTMTIVYGSTASGGPGATATTTYGAEAWTETEVSLSGGDLTSLVSQPSITVSATTDGSSTQPS